MEKLEFTTEAGINEYVSYIKAPDSSKTLLVFHEWWGLNDNIKNLCRQFADDLPGINIMAIDLYQGQFTDDPDTAAKLKQALVKDVALKTISSAINKFAYGHTLASIGYCMGGMWSLQSAILTGNKMDACVMYYGMPELNVDQLSILQAPVLGIFADFDPWITPDIVEEFKSNMKTAGKQLICHSFPAHHAFANSANQGYDSQCSAKAYELTIEFLRQRLGLVS